MHELRCDKCNKLLFKYKLEGIVDIEIKCKKCNVVKKVMLWEKKD